MRIGSVLFERLGHRPTHQLTPQKSALVALLVALHGSSAQQLKLWGQKSWWLSAYRHLLPYLNTIQLRDKLDLA